MQAPHDRVALDMGAGVILVTLRRYLCWKSGTHVVFVPWTLVSRCSKEQFPICQPDSQKERVQTWRLYRYVVRKTSQTNFLCSRFCFDKDRVIDRCLKSLMKCGHGRSNNPQSKDALPHSFLSVCRMRLNITPAVVAGLSIARVHSAKGKRTSTPQAEQGMSARLWPEDRETLSSRIRREQRTFTDIVLVLFGAHCLFVEFVIIDNKLTERSWRPSRNQESKTLEKIFSLAERTILWDQVINPLLLDMRSSAWTISRFNTGPILCKTDLCSLWIIFLWKCESVKIVFCLSFWKFWHTRILPKIYELVQTSSIDPRVGRGKSLSTHSKRGPQWTVGFQEGRNKKKITKSNLGTDILFCHRPTCWQLKFLHNFGFTCKGDKVCHHGCVIFMAGLVMHTSNVETLSCAIFVCRLPLQESLRFKNILLIPTGMNTVKETQKSKHNKASKWRFIAIEIVGARMLWSCEEFHWGDRFQKVQAFRP